MDSHQTGDGSVMVGRFLRASQCMDREIGAKSRASDPLFSLEIIKVYEIFHPAI
jgi:hypothetical protein